MQLQQLLVMYLQFVVCLCLLTQSYSGPEKVVKFFQIKKLWQFLVFFCGDHKNINQRN